MGAEIRTIRFAPAATALENLGLTVDRTRVSAVDDGSPAKELGVQAGWHVVGLEDEFGYHAVSENNAYLRLRAALISRAPFTVFFDADGDARPARASDNRPSSQSSQRTLGSQSRIARTTSPEASAHSIRASHPSAPKMQEATEYTLVLIKPSGVMRGLWREVGTGTHTLVWRLLSLRAVCMRACHDA